MLGNQYNAQFKQATFQTIFGESNGGFATDHYPWKCTRYSIPKLLDAGINYAGVGVASSGAPLPNNGGYVALDSIAIVVY